MLQILQNHIVRSVPQLTAAISEIMPHFSLRYCKKDEELLTYYETTGLAQADAIIKAANIAYRAGEVSFADLSQFLTQAIDIQRNYLEVLNQYNQSAIQLNYFLNR